jgi:hypothetical protein
MLVAGTAVSLNRVDGGWRVLPELFHAGSSLMGAMVSRVMDPGGRRRSVWFEAERSERTVLRSASRPGLPAAASIIAWLGLLRDPQHL